MADNDVLITGIGLLSSLGEGHEETWQRLASPGFAPTIDAETLAPYPVHPLPEIDWNKQIPKRSDQRQMELWQRLGTYTAGLALDDAGLKELPELRAVTDMIVAAGGGERDEAVDESILAAAEGRADLDVLLNERLTTDLRPTLFLAQLSNLLAGNISIVHNVTGSSRTFMGEESAGIAALGTAHARIASGQSDITLVGGAFQSTHRSMILGHALGKHLLEGEWKPVWDRAGSSGGGLVPGSGGAFLVLESRKHAEARGAKPYARLAGVVSSRARAKDDRSEIVGKLLDGVDPTCEPLMLVSGNSGAHAAVEAETGALSARPHLHVRGIATAVGHLQEPQFVFATALAALAVHKTRALPPLSGSEKAIDRAPARAAALTVGHVAGEGVALVEAA